MARSNIPLKSSKKSVNSLPSGGKIVARRAFGESGPGLRRSTSRPWEVAAAAAAGLTEGDLHHPLGATSPGGSNPEAPPAPTANSFVRSNGRTGPWRSQVAT